MGCGQETGKRLPWNNSGRDPVVVRTKRDREGMGGSLNTGHRRITLYPKLLIDFYEFEDSLPADEKFLEHIAKKRNFIIKGNKLNLLKAAISFINDYRNGVIGKISLETPSSRELMLKNLL